MVIKVLSGIVVIDDDIKQVIVDLIEYGQQVVIVRGGRGGRGNFCFVILVNFVFQFLENGELGKECYVVFELKVFVDVGFVGFLSVGKFILLFVVLFVKLKIVDYYFIMFVLNFGMVEMDDGCSFVMVDLLGLIEGVY